MKDEHRERLQTTAVVHFEPNSFFLKGNAFNFETVGQAWQPPVKKKKKKKWYSCDTCAIGERERKGLFFNRHLRLRSVSSAFIFQKGN